MIVDFNSETWTDPWFRKLTRECKILFIYLWTNSHKNVAGLYVIDMETMAFETGLTLEETETALSTLHPKVKYDERNKVVWVVNHVRHQYMKTTKISPKIVTAITKNLLAISPHHFVTEFLDWYPTLELDGIPYQDTLSEYPTGGGEGKGSSKGESNRETCISPEWDKIGQERDKTF